MCMNYLDLDCSGICVPYVFVYIQAVGYMAEVNAFVIVNAAGCINNRFFVYVKNKVV